VIVKHNIKITPSGSQLTIVAKNKAFVTTINKKSAVFMDKKDSEVIEQLISDANLSVDIDATDVQHTSMIQFDATDWDFINMRSEANGMLVNVGDEKITIKKPDTSGDAKLTLKYGDTIIEAEAEIDGRSINGPKTKSWSYTDQKILDGDADVDGLTEQGDLKADDLASKLNIKPIEISNGATLVQQEMVGIANIAKVKGTLSKIRGKITCIGFDGILPGDMLAVDGAGKHFNGNGFVSGVFHDITAGKWQTQIVLGLDNRMYADWYTNNTTKPASGILPGVNGLQVGVVSKIDSDPDGEDRILVKIPIANADEDAVWARVARLDAGKERGSFFLPEENDEVILGFVNDDPRHAVVLGMLNSSKLPAPLKADSKNPEKGFITREKIKLIFNDDKKIVTIETPGGNKIEINDDKKSITLTDQNSNKIEMSDKGISMESQKDIKLKASGDIKMEGNNVEIKAQANFKAEGTAGTSIKSSAITEVKGSMVNIN